MCEGKVLKQTTRDDLLKEGLLYCSEIYSEKIPVTVVKEPIEIKEAKQFQVLNVFNVGTTKQKRNIPEKPEGAIRFVCVSDTHGTHRQIQIPQADVFIHSGIFINILS